MQVLAVVGIILGVLGIVIVYFKAPKSGMLSELPNPPKDMPIETNTDDISIEDVLNEDMINEDTSLSDLSEEFPETTIRDMFQDKGSILAMIGAFIFFITIILVLYFKFYIGIF